MIAWVIFSMATSPIPGVSRESSTVMRSMAPSLADTSTVNSPCLPIPVPIAVTSPSAFLSLPAAASLFLAAASSWLMGAQPARASVPPSAARAPVSYTHLDFLIIGAGTAGLAAAGAAADLGLNFIACDKSNQVPETREYLGGVDTAYAKANNVTIDRPKLLNELTRYASGKCNQKLIKRWIDDSAEYIDWVTEVMKDAGKEVMLDLSLIHIFQAIHVEILVQGQVIALRDDERVHSGEHGRVLHDLVPALGDTQQHDAGVGAGIEVGWAHERCV